MNLTLKIWTQKDQKSKGKRMDYKVTWISLRAHVFLRNDGCVK